MALKIVGIVGICDFKNPYDSLWKHFQEEFEKEFPDASFVSEHVWYFPWEFQKMRDFASKLAQKYDTGDELILVGYSLGGVIASVIVPLLTKSKVKGIVTVFAPHRFLFGIFPWMLGVSTDAKSPPVLSVTGYLDWVVWWGAQHPHAKKHESIWCDHLLGLLFSRKPAARIAELAQEAFGGPT